MLAGRRMLVLIDDAITADQVRPLLPGTGHCTVIITSRRRLPGLSIQEGATRIRVPALERRDACAVLTAHLPHLGPQAEPQAERIATACSGIPLALHAAGEYLRDAHPHADLDGLADLLTGPTRLHVLTSAAGEDHQAALRPLLALSYRRLDPHAARLFRRIGHHLDDDDVITSTTAATLLQDPNAADLAISGLATEHLLLPTEHGYRCPSLIRSYATELAKAEQAGRHAYGWLGGSAAGVGDAESLESAL